MISYDRAKLFLGKKVHISCDGRFYNGELIKIDSQKVFLVIDDLKFGETPVLLNEILNIDPYVEEGK